MTDEELLQTRTYTNTSGIVCTSNYINDLKILNANSEGKYDDLLADLQKTSEYLPINIFKSNPTLNLLYNEVILKEGDQISLISRNIPEGFYDNAYAWRTSDPDIAEVTNGVITAKKAGKVTISAVQTYLFDFKHNLFVTVDVVSQEPQGENTVQTLSQSNLVGFTDPDVIPQITIVSNEDINATTTVTNCFDVLDGKIEMIGQPIDVQSSSDFEWAEISFTLSQDQLNSVDMNDLVIYWYDDENGAIIPQVTKVDATTGKVSAVVNHFSKYFLSKISIQNETINIAFLIDSYYGDQASLDIYKTNITNTVLELRKQANVKIVFVDNNEENPKEIQNLYFGKVKDPTEETNNKVTNRINSVFNYINPLDNTLQGGIIEESSQALRKGRLILLKNSIISNMLGTKPKTYALLYTEWGVVFHDNQSIVLDMKDSIGLVVGKIIGYYEDQPIAYDESNIQPLVKFLLRGDYSLISTEKMGIKSWEIKCEGENNTEDVIVMQKVLINRGYLIWPKDASDNLLPFGTFDTVTRNAVMKYQVFNGMIPSGVVDKNTWLSLSLPWDNQNEEPQRSSYKYIKYLNQDQSDIGPASALLQKLADGQTVAVDDFIRIIANGTNCKYMLLYINDKFIAIQSGNYFEYNYKIPSCGDYSIQVRASNMPVPYGAEFSASNIITFRVEECYDKIEDIKELSYGYHEFFIKELESKVYVYITNPAADKITFSIGEKDQHETVSEIASASDLNPIVAMNAGGFDMTMPKAEHFGVLIVNGEELEPISPQMRPLLDEDGEAEVDKDGNIIMVEVDVYKQRVKEANTFIKWKNGETEISKITEDNIPYIKKNAEWAIGAGYTLIDTNKGIKNDGTEEGTAYIKKYGNNWFVPRVRWKARTMFGVKKSGEFILAVIEGGGASDNKGANDKEEANVMEQLGAVLAINFDGGGSSTFWKAEEGNKFVAENENGRKIGSIIMVIK